MYSRQISHVKPLDHWRAVLDRNFRASPLQIAQLEFVERNLNPENVLGEWPDFASQKTSEVFRDFGSLAARLTASASPAGFPGGRRRS